MNHQPTRVYVRDNSALYISGLRRRSLAALSETKTLYIHIYNEYYNATLQIAVKVQAITITTSSLDTSLTNESDLRGTQR